MKRILPAIAALAFCSPAFAGLGPASSSKPAAYDAWCGEKGNDCKVSFDGGKITVDGKHSVSFDQLTYITRNRGDYNSWNYSYTHTFGIEYTVEGQTAPEFAEILFMNNDTANRFWRDLQRACRNCKDINRQQVDVNINP